MDTAPQSSLLFTLRLWKEPVDAEKVEWRGKLQHVLSGEVRYFRDWPTLIAALAELLAKYGQGSSTTQPDSSSF